jgi:hypothetical protein
MREVSLERLPSLVTPKATLVLKTLNDTTLPFLASLRSLNAHRTCVMLKKKCKLL